jgi:hypothetical protein
MSTGELQITAIIQNILNDTDLEHLTVKDLRNVVLNIQDVILPELEEEPQNLEKYVL